MNKILFGADTICEQVDLYKNVRFGLVTNNAATTSSGILSRTAMLKAGIKINKLFSPEHGLTAAGEDGSFQHHSIDEITNLPVISLYGDHFMPSPEDMEGIDMILFDIPDVGCRFYTYLWTLTYIMEACAINNKKLIILDRPNPLGGDLEKAEGPMLDEKNCASFIGRWSIPIRHSCTLGELAIFFAATKIKNIDIEVIPVKLDLVQNSKTTDLNFTPPSPAISDIETAFLYPGTGLLEGININEGRGTVYPFKLIGAPWINKEKLSNAFQHLDLLGVISNPVSYTPTSGIYAEEICHGLLLSVTNKISFSPVECGLKLLSLFISLFADSCKERLYPTVANPTGMHHLDRLLGINQSFDKIKKGEILSTKLLKNEWEELIGPYLIYLRDVE